MEGVEPSSSVALNGFLQVYFVLVLLTIERTSVVGVPSRGFKIGCSPASFPRSYLLCASLRPPYNITITLVGG